jgi:hypothetical protein
LCSFDSFYSKPQLNTKYFDEVFLSLVLLIALRILPLSSVYLVSYTPLLQLQFPKFLWWGERAYWYRRKKYIYTTPTKDKVMHSDDLKLSLSLFISLLPLSQSFMLWWAWTDGQFQISKWMNLYTQWYVLTNTCNKIYFRRISEPNANKKDNTYFTILCWMKSQC